MDISFRWLNQYVEQDWAPDDLAERLTMAGLEVETVGVRVLADRLHLAHHHAVERLADGLDRLHLQPEIGRASCRERVCLYV